MRTAEGAVGQSILVAPVRLRGGRSAYYGSADSDTGHARQAKKDHVAALGRFFRRISRLRVCSRLAATAPSTVIAP